MTYLRLSLRYVLATISIIILSIALFFIIKEALAWTNPSVAPPGGSGAITVSGGNVGIGTTAPNHSLHIARAGSDLLRLQNTSVGTTADFRFLVESGGLGLYDNEDLAYRMFINTSGNVGIGTTSPDSNYKITTSGGGIKAENSSASQPAGYFSNAGGGSALQLGTGSLKFGDGTTQSTAGGASLWSSSGSNISNTNSGNVGIGTTAPNHSLHIARAGSDLLRLQNTSVGTTADFRFLVESGGLGLYDNEDLAYRMFINTSGNVGIGTTGPSYRLDVVSGGGTTARFGTAAGDTIVVGGGSGKITAGTIDPLYSIAGGKYATYLPAMIGQKEELAGTVNLQCDNGSCSSVLDFASAPQGSDLWLFNRITDLGADFNNLVVILSPSFDGKVWYKKDPNNSRLIIYGDKNGEVSYRLTAPRFDWQKWSNISNEPHDGLIVPDKGK